MLDWIKRHKWLALAIAVIVVVIGTVIATTGAPEVTVARASVGPLTLRIAASGIVETQSADLSFKGSGRLVGLYVQEGDAVTKSQLLARITSSVGSMGTSGVTDIIQAPYDGHVVEIYQRIGTVVAPGQPVLRIVSTRKPWVTAFIDSEDATYLRLGQKLRCRAGGYLSAGWDLVVREIGKEAVPRHDMPGSSRQVRVRCDVVNRAFPLAPGTEVDIDGDVRLLDKAVLVPTAAVVHEGARNWVWLVEEGKVQQREVRLGPNNFDFIQVRDGVEPGDEVVVQGKEGLRDGQRVRTQPMPPMDEDAEGGS